MATAASRVKLACTACTRRKVKCSKSIPCTNCTRRGEENLCSNDDIQNQTSAELSARDDELDLLRRKVVDLEAQLIQSHHPSERQLSPTLGDPVLQDPSPAASTAMHQQHVETTTTQSVGVLQDAASILEFLAWGRRKDPHFQNAVSPEMQHVQDQETTPNVLEDFSSMMMIELLLPDAAKIQQLVDYHCESLLWYHGSFFASRFQSQLAAFLGEFDGRLTNPTFDMQWVALLFSIMTGSLTCAPQTLAQSWGYRDDERATLSRQWFRAITSCLNCAEYTSHLSIFSCQAIATGTIAAHLLGFSSAQSIHLAAAVRVAQSLGLHRLDLTVGTNNIDKETGRRVWTQLSTQDWFGIPFSESYLINPVYSTSKSPTNCHDHDLIPLPPNIPTTASYCRFRRDIASIMPKLQDGLMSCNTPYTKYEQVLKWDATLRNLAVQERPVFLTSCPLDPDWPPWVKWARRALAISSSHKIIMIHRSFLSQSFSNKAFDFTRRTCLAASKTIIKEYKLVSEEDGPVLWVYQAFAVAAGIILSLDTLSRGADAQGSAEHRELIESVLNLLHLCQNSTIASRGIKVLKAMLSEISKSAAMPRGTKRNRDGVTIGSFDVAAFIKEYHEASRRSGTNDGPGTRESPPIHTENDSPHSINSPSQDFNFPFGLSMSDNMHGFENLLYLANYDPFSS